MIITIDTIKDSPEDINRAIDILKQYTKPIVEDDSEILANIPKFPKTHRPSGPGIFDVQKNEEAVEQEKLEKVNIENKTEGNNLEELKEQSSFKSELFDSDNNLNPTDNNKSTITFFDQSPTNESDQTETSVEDTERISIQTDRPNIEYHGGRISKGTPPDFTSYLDFLKQKRDKQVLGILAEQNTESKEQE